jgi:hypothetical protein
MAAEAAIEFYTATFPNSEVRSVARTGKDGPISSAEFVVGGQLFMGYNGGPYPVTKLPAAQRRRPLPAPERVARRRRACWMPPTETEIELVRAALAETVNDPSVGRVVCSVALIPPAKSDVDRIDALLRDHCGIQANPTILLQVSVDDASFVLCAMFRGWLFSAAPATDAKRLVRVCFSWFDSNVRCYSTYRFEQTSSCTYNATGRSLIGDTHDIGILWVDQSRVGITWLADAD